MKYQHPYENLSARAYWRKAVSDVSPFNIQGLYEPRHVINKDIRIAAAGSCFAQHIARNLKKRGYNFLDMELSPPGLSAQSQQAYGYNTYSARYGNIYSIGQLLQLFQRAYGRLTPKESYWENNGRFYDPFRPSIEPGGFESIEELEGDVRAHLDSVKRLIRQAELFVFTFGLTEAWINKEDGSILPTCPGTIAGTFDPEKYEFHNFKYSEVMEQAKRFIAFATRRNPEIKFLFTVSPVPLTATASGNHVLPATLYSKSVLRAACGELCEIYPQCDYFPSFEIISSHPFRGMFFEPNMRGVTANGVDHAMSQFFSAHSETSGSEFPVSSDSSVTPFRTSEKSTEWDVENDVVCEEEILESFGSK